MNPIWKAAVASSLLSGGVLGCGSNGTGPNVALSVESVTPANLASGVAIGAPIVITFSKAIQSSSVTATTVSLMTRGLVVPGSVAVGGDSRTVTLTPQRGLGNNLSYRLTVSAVKDVAGVALAAPFTSTFTTPPATVAINDPAGDTYGVGSTGLVQPDITSVTATQDVGGATITIVLRFAQPVEPFISGGTNAVGGLIDLDTDQNSATGILSATDAFRPDGGSSDLGDEFWVSLFLNSDGTAPIIDAVSGTLVGSVLPAFNGNTVTIRIPLTLLGGDDGNVNLATVVGTEVEPTDVAPDDGHLTLGTSGGLSPAVVVSAGARAGSAGRTSGFVPVWGAR